MTDVVINVHGSGSPMNPGGTYTHLPFGSGAIIAPKIINNYPISGDFGIEDNGYLDQRFDDTQYYTT